MKKYIYAYILIAASVLTTWFIFNFHWVKTKFKFIIGMLMPFIIGVVLAYMLTPLYNRVYDSVKKENAKKPLALLTCALSMLGTAVILISLILPGFVQSISTIISRSREYTNIIYEWVDNNKFFQQYFSYAIDYLTKNLSSIIETITINGGNAALSFVSSALARIYELFIGFVVSLYVLSEKNSLKAKETRISKVILKDKYDQVSEFATFASDMFSAFLRGKVLDSLLIGVICFLVMTILRMPYTLLISVIIGLTNIIPFFGPFIGAIPSLLLLLVENPISALEFLILIVILQQLDGNVIGPRILGNVTGVSPFWVLFSILVFGKLFGVIGMIIGVPLFAVIEKLLDQYLTILENKDKQSAEAK